MLSVDQAFCESFNLFLALGCFCDLTSDRAQKFSKRFFDVENIIIVTLNTIIHNTRIVMS